WVMQAYSLLVDKNLAYDDLKTLDTKLKLPPGWKYRVKVRQGSWNRCDQRHRACHPGRSGGHLQRVLRDGQADELHLQAVTGFPRSARLG
ncbi:MAG TPA: hypothetical protein VMH26_07105, partial [Burkholderiales bacterium]|nr:hypothetical protein [Burkholderiales bacterium]